MVFSPFIFFPDILLLKMPDYHLPLLPGRSYHLFSRANGNEKLFIEADNYNFFLQRLQKYILPIAEINSYCLIPNHFHLLATMRETGVLEEQFRLMKKNQVCMKEFLSNFIMERFSNMLNSYAKAFNNKYSRKGSLFMDYMRRVEIETLAQLKATVYYIHKNPVHHGCCKSPIKWEWSSYRNFFSNEFSFIEKEKILKCFGGKDEFLAYHSRPLLGVFPSGSDNINSHDEDHSHHFRPGRSAYRLES